MQNARLDESQAGIKIAGRNINNLRYADDITLMAESEEELRSLFMIVKEVSEKASLKLNIQKMIMVFCSISSWQIDGENMETVIGFILGGSKITAEGNCNHEIKRCLLLGRIAMTNLDSVLKSRDITLLTPVHIVKAMVFPEVMYRWASPISQLVKNPPAMQETLVRFLGREDSPGEGIGYPLQYSWASLVAQLVKNPLATRETWV